MRRFRKGTLDHDGDGRKGGSMPAKRTTKTRTTRKAPARKPTEEQLAIQAEATTMATAPDPQSGGVGVIDEDGKPSAKQVKAARQAAIDEQFAVADEKGAPTSEEVRDNNLRMAARGF